MPTVLSVVSNTGPLIALAGIGQFHLLRGLFGTVYIPSAVKAEVQDETSLAALSAADWIVVCVVQGGFAVQLLREELDPGECEAIVLAGELGAALLLVDERAAIHRARAVGLQAVGTLGVLLMAKDRGLLNLVKPSLDDLRRTGFHMSEILYRRVLYSAGEG